MSPKERRALQKQFLERLAKNIQPLEELMDDLDILPETFISWTDERDFKSKLHGLRRYLRKARDLQLEVSSFRAAYILANLTTVEKSKSANPVTRSACVDVIRLARDSRVRRRTQEAETLGRERLLSHPDLSEEEALRLTAELSASVATGAASGDETEEKSK